nr:MAG TPA: hypothetical protein [Caudoviricetes sp.]
MGRIINMSDYIKEVNTAKMEMETNPNAEIDEDLFEEDEDVETLIMGKLSDIDEYLRGIEEGCMKLREVLGLDGETFNNGD